MSKLEYGELTPPTATVRRQMQTQKTSGTKIEMAVRRRLHAQGYRYRVNCRLLPDQRFTGDIAWLGRRLVVFLDGCFWHGCPLHGTTPRSNRAWWESKIAANRERDRRVDELLAARGWTVLRFWEHDDPEAVAVRIIDHLNLR
jgi:DNA mismatch endonuclease (patch repair protein)